MRSVIGRPLGAILSLALGIAMPAASRADILLGHSGDLSGTSAALTKDYLRGM